MAERDDMGEVSLEFGNIREVTFEDQIDLPPDFYESGASPWMKLMSNFVLSREFGLAFSQASAWSFVIPTEGVSDDVIDGWKEVANRLLGNQRKLIDRFQVEIERLNQEVSTMLVPLRAESLVAAIDEPSWSSERGACICLGYEPQDNARSWAEEHRRVHPQAEALAGLIWVADKQGSNDEPLTPKNFVRFALGQGFSVPWLVQEFLGEPFRDATRERLESGGALSRAEASSRYVDIEKLKLMAAAWSKSYTVLAERNVNKAMRIAINKHAAASTDVISHKTLEKHVQEGEELFADLRARHQRRDTEG